jgi:hypothetical protein
MANLGASHDNALKFVVSHTSNLRRAMTLRVSLSEIEAQLRCLGESGRCCDTPKRVKGILIGAELDYLPMYLAR